MKKISTLLSFMVLLASLAGAQSFTLQHDSVFCTPTGAAYILPDDIIASSAVTLQWKSLSSSDFPSDWIANIGICDNHVCYPSAAIWPPGSVKTSSPYAAGTPGDFHMVLNADAFTTLGTYYFRVRLNNQAVTSDTAIATFVVSKLSPTSAPSVKVFTDDVVLYPNPANNEINLVYDAGLDVKSIGVYNIIGKMMAVYKVAASSANLRLDGMPSGIYVVRLVNGQGNVVATKKFTKQ